MCSSFRSTKLAPILSLSLVLSKYLILPNFFPLPPPLSFSFFFSLSLYTARQYRSEMGKTCSSTSLYLTSQVLLTLLSQLKLLFYFVFVLVSFWFFFFKTEIVPIRSLHIDQLHYQILMPCRLEWVKSKIFTGYFIDLLVYQ